MMMTMLFMSSWRGSKGISDSTNNSTHADSAECLLSCLIIFAPHCQVISIGFHQFTHVALLHMCLI